VWALLGTLAAPISVVEGVLTGWARLALLCEPCLMLFSEVAVGGLYAEPRTTVVMLRVSSAESPVGVRSSEENSLTPKVT